VRGANLNPNITNAPLVAGGLPYCSLFSDVDGLFSALQPYGKEGGGGELQLGSSCVILPPCEPTLAAAYARRALDGMQSRDGRTYWLVLPQACFRAHREVRQGGGKEATILPTILPYLRSRRRC
jgi:hypothetical protein